MNNTDKIIQITTVIDIETHELLTNGLSERGNLYLLQYKEDKRTKEWKPYWKLEVESPYYID